MELSDDRFVVKRTATYPDPVNPLLSHPAVLPVVPVRDGNLVQCETNILLPSSSEHDLEKVFELLLGSFEFSRRGREDVDLDDLGSSDGGGVGESDREGDGSEGRGR